MSNKNLRKSLASRNGNEIIIWSWNNPTAQFSMVVLFFGMEAEHVGAKNIFLVDGCGQFFGCVFIQSQCPCPL